MNKSLTPYAQAWKDYRLTADYLRCEAELLRKGIIQPYADNILRSAFDAGFNSKLRPGK